jgi:hypothetical protein
MLLRAVIGIAGCAHYKTTGQKNLFVDGKSYGDILNRAAFSALRVYGCWSVVPIVEIINIQWGYKRCTQLKHDGAKWWFVQ